MTNNERIARWLGVKQIDFSHTYKDRELVLSGNSPMQQVDLCRTDNAKGWKSWRPDTNIGLWHGKDGLLSKIEERGEDFVSDFICELDIDLLGTDDMWECGLFAAIRATPEQLTMALIDVINEDGL